MPTFVPSRPALCSAAQVTEDFAIQPEKITPTLDASKWPLLLKNYDKLMVRASMSHPPPRAIVGEAGRRMGFLFWGSVRASSKEDSEARANSALDAPHESAHHRSLCDRSSG